MPSQRLSAVLGLVEKARRVGATRAMREVRRRVNAKPWAPMVAPQNRPTNGYTVRTVLCSCGRQTTRKYLEKHGHCRHCELRSTRPPATVCPQCGGRSTANAIARYGVCSYCRPHRKPERPTDRYLTGAEKDAVISEHIAELERHGSLKAAREYNERRRSDAPLAIDAFVRLPKPQRMRVVADHLYGHRRTRKTRSADAMRSR